MADERKDWFVAMCRSPKCYNSNTAGWSGLKYDEGDDTPYHRDEPPPKFCTLCGLPVIAECVTCHRMIRNFEDKFCPNCGSQYRYPDKYAV